MITRFPGAAGSLTKHEDRNPLAQDLAEILTRPQSCAKLHARNHILRLGNTCPGSIRGITKDSIEPGPGITKDCYRKSGGQYEKKG